jgi:23S rRNA (cytosine1962-C5)-methyltransferase
LSSSEGASASRIILKPGRESPARKRHHPWIYSQAISGIQGESSGSDLLPVVAADGTPVGWGFFSPASLIAVRMISFIADAPPRDWIEQRIASALSLRRTFGLDSDAFRIVNSEGDFLPGLIVDLYGDTAVMTAHVKGMEAQSERIAASLQDLLPGVRVYFKRDEHYARVEGLSRASGYIRGQGDGRSIIREDGVRLVVDCQEGQKTGFYLDQRENRRLIARASAGRRLLNLFSYTGAVALAAASAGATRVVSVESSRRAVELAHENVRLNSGAGSARLEWVQADVFSFLENAGIHDVVVADPPPFARRRAELEGALQGYLTLFQQCLRILTPGGFAFLFSCSGAVDRPTFRDVVVEAARRAGKSVRLLRELHADVDHPVAATHPEGEYLKGWMVHAE